MLVRSFIVIILKVSNNLLMTSNIGHLNTLELPDPKIIMGGEGNLQNELKTPKTKVKSIINITSQPF